MREELLNGLTEEQKKKVVNCKSTDEIVSLAKEEGVQLNDEQLGAVSGGGCGSPKYDPVCMKCASRDVTCEKDIKIDGDDGIRRCHYICNNCKYEWHTVDKCD